MGQNQIVKGTLVQRTIQSTYKHQEVGELSNRCHYETEREHKYFPDPEME
jgi:hypothetical protein